jgi:hypothetical protein
MRTSTFRLTPAAAEHLLDGGNRPAELHQLLAAAAGPGTARELAGEPTAVAAFVAAPHQTPLPSDPRRHSMLSTALSKILAAKALAAVVLLAGATGGVALAANSTDTSDDATATTSTTEDKDTDSSSTDDTTDPADASKRPADAKTPDPSLQGLCRAFAAGAMKDKENPPPAFDALIAAAGTGADIAKFCTEFTAPGHSADAPGQVAKKTESAEPTETPDDPADEDAKAPKKSADSVESTDTDDDEGDKSELTKKSGGRSGDVPAAPQSGKAVDR